MIVVREQCRPVAAFARETDAEAWASAARARGSLGVDVDDVGLALEDAATDGTRSKLETAERMLGDVRSELYDARSELDEAEREIQRLRSARGLAAICRDANDNSRSKGFWDDRDLSPMSVATSLALIHSEVSEALEEVRDNPDLGAVRTTAAGKPEGFLSEMADVLIRVADLIGQAGLGEQLEQVVDAKMRFNATRPHKHGGKTL